MVDLSAKMRRTLFDIAHGRTTYAAASTLQALCSRGYLKPAGASYVATQEGRFALCSTRASQPASPTAAGALR